MSHNTLIHRVVRGGVRPLVGTRITPNHLTTLRLLTGLGAAVALATGNAAASAWGAGLFLVSMLFDRADGELARLANKRSAFGHRYDVISDGVSTVLVFVGLGIGLAGGALGPWAIGMGVLAGTGVVAAFSIMWRAEAVGIRSTVISDKNDRFDPDDAMIAVPIAIWLGASEQMLIAAAVGAPVFAIFAYARFTRAQRRHAQQQDCRLDISRREP